MERMYAHNVRQIVSLPRRGYPIFHRMVERALERAPAQITENRV